MTLTATYDKNARVTLNLTSNPATGTVWSKSVDGGSTWHSITTTGAGVQSLVDKVPNHNWKSIPHVQEDMTEVFTAVEFGIYADPLADQYFTITVDGTPYIHEITIGDDTEAHRVDHMLNQIVWGISGLPLTQHTVTITEASPGVGGGRTWDDTPDDEHWVWWAADWVWKSTIYSDMSVPLGTTIKYRAVVDGGAPQYCDVTPMVDKRAALQSLVDRMIAGNGILAACSEGNSYGDSLSGISGAYYLLQDSRLPQIASDLYDMYMAVADAETGRVFSYNWVIDFRLIMGLWSAYKAFGDSKYLTQADKVATWVLSYETIATGIPNQTATAMYGCALLYNEPASSHYQSSALRTKIETAANVYIPQQIVDGTGAINYFNDGGPAEYQYACYEWPMIRYISDKWGWQTSEIANATDWLAHRFPMTEPYFFRSEYHGYTGPMNCLIKAFAYYKHHGSIPKDYIDMLYSASFDWVWQTGVTLGEDNEYLPEGFASSTAPLAYGQFTYSIFEAVQFAVALNVPLGAWWLLNVPPLRISWE